MLPITKGFQGTDVEKEKKNMPIRVSYLEKEQIPDKRKGKGSKVTSLYPT